MNSDPVALRGIDHVRFFVGNAKQSAYFYRNAFGFDVVAYAGLETGVKHEAAYVLRQGDITFVLTSSLRANDPDNMRLMFHGDGVKDVALAVEDVKAAFDSAVRNGAIGVTAPVVQMDDDGAIETATIRAYGDTTHTFINRDSYRGVFAPGFKKLDPDRYNPRTFHPVGLKAIDHIVANVEEGKMDEWVRWYERVLGFQQLVHFDDKDISTEYTALMSKVVQNGSGRIKFPINEPAKAKRRSQIDEYLQFYGGPACSTLRWLPTTLSRPYARCGPTTCPSCACRKRTTKCSPNASARSRRVCTMWRSLAFWSTAMMKAISCRFSPSRSRTDRRYSSK